MKRKELEARIVQEHLDRKATADFFEYRRPYTVVIISRDYHKDRIYGVGVSKVCWPDKWDDERGYYIALVRAARDLTKTLFANHVKLEEI